MFDADVDHRLVKLYDARLLPQPYDDDALGGVADADADPARRS